MVYHHRRQAQQDLQMAKKGRKILQNQRKVKTVRIRYATVIKIVSCMLNMIGFIIYIFILKSLIYFIAFCNVCYN